MYFKNKLEVKVMKKVVLSLFLVVVLVGCKSEQDFLDEAEMKIKAGQYQEAKKDLDIAKLSTNKKIKQSAKTFEKIIDDSLLAFEIRKLKMKRNDNILLGFKFGMLKNEAEKHVKSLLVKKELKPKTTYTLTMGSGEYEHKFKLRGYEFDFHIKDYVCKSILSYHNYFEGLSKVEIALLEYPSKKSSESVLKDVIQMFATKYGKHEKTSLFYRDEESKDSKAFWQDSNKSIYISYVGSLIIISIEDLISKIEYDNYLKGVRGIIEENNLEKSQQRVAS